MEYSRQAFREYHRAKRSTTEDIIESSDDEIITHGDLKESVIRKVVSNRKKAKRLIARKIRSVKAGE